MQPLADLVRTQLRSVFAGRSVVIAGGVAASATARIAQLRELGAERFLVVATGPGTGPQPIAPDVEIVDLFARPPSTADLMEAFREEERTIAQPPTAVLEALARFDPQCEAVALAAPFLDVRTLGDRSLFGARRSDWVALEDKTRVAALFDAAGVPRPPSAVVDADPTAIQRAAVALDRGAGTVWSGDSREGFNGGAERVRWVRDAADAREALDQLVPTSDRVRVASFADGVPCSIHGFVVADGVAVLRPVELVTLRAPSVPRLK